MGSPMLELAAAVPAGTWAPIALALAGLVGAVFAALRFNRDDATAVVAQQSTVLADMRSLNEELAEAAARVRLERDDLAAKIILLTAEIAALRVQITALQVALETLTGGPKAPIIGGARDEPR